MTDRWQNEFNTKTTKIEEKMNANEETLIQHLFSLNFMNY